MTDFLLELRSEEIPARMQRQACADLERLFAEKLAAHDVKAEGIETFATPRRLALIARGLPERTEATREERRGPRTDAPDKAIEGFLRGAGLTRDQLEVREEKKGSFYYAVIESAGADMGAILSGAVGEIVRDFSWPKSMRWGAASSSMDSLRWVRPLQGIVALFGGEIVSVKIGTLHAGRHTVGHRFMSDGEIEISGADDYADKLRAARVIVDANERQQIILDGAKAACAEAGLTLIEDAALLAENAGLTEWPVPLLGRFDAAFLDVPPEVIQLAMKTHQKYFSVADADGKLTNAFVCTANIEAPDGGAKIVAGNEKVLAARLSDARFFWEQDLKTGLDAMREKLGDIVFHEKLGTIADKVERVAKLARWLAEEGIVAADPDKAERAARLAKADLVSQMVYEFPELQGVMGGYYAAKAGEDPEIASAIRDHYKPVGQNDEVPTAPVTVAVSLADKLDTIAGFFRIDERPTGSRDPFGLRRAAFGIIRLLVENGLRLPLEYASARAVVRYNDVTFAADMSDKSYKAALSELKSQDVGENVVFEIPAFFADRLKVQQREAGVRHDLIDAVFALGGEDDIVRLLARVKALQAFMETEAGAALLAGYKRANNILKAEAKKGDLPAGIGSEPSVTPAKAGAQIERQDVAPDDLDSGLRRNDGHGRLTFPYDPEPAEAALAAALETASADAGEAVEDERFEDAMAALAALRGPIDTFFEEVIVNADDAEKRAHRLALLTRIRDAAHEVADFSKIEG